MPILIALIFAFSLPVTLWAARDPEDLTKLLQDADRALAEPEPAPAPEKPFNDTTVQDIPVSEPAAEDVPAAAEEVPAVSQYKVWIWQESGDTLWRIAQKVYGDKDKWRLIYLANKDVIKDPNKIYPKQKLKIPPADWQP